MQYVGEYPKTRSYTHVRHESAWTIQKGPRNRPLFWQHGDVFVENSALAARFGTQLAAERMVRVQGYQNVRVAEHWWQVR